MLFFSYDESNGFEQDSISRNATIISGFIYDSCNEKKYKGNNDRIVNLEQERVRFYLEKVCNACEAGFPQDLHVSRNRNNEKAVKKVKIKVAETLAEFINKGTYDNKPLVYNVKGVLKKEGKAEQAVGREGHYQLITIFLGEDENGAQATEEISFLNDAIAGNRYVNMVSETIKKGVFLNTSIEESNPTISFYIPTRVVPNPVLNNQHYSREAKELLSIQYKRLLKQSTQLGYEHVSQKNDDGSYLDFVRIISQGTAQQIIKSHSESIRTINVSELNINSIKYDDISQTRQFAFLYLADLICSHLSHGTKPGNGNDKQAQLIRKRMNKLNNRKNNLFFYYGAAGSVDYYYNEAATALIGKDLFGALRNVYDGRKLNKGFAKKYYSKRWYSFIENEVVQNTDIRAFRKALASAREYRLEDNLGQGRLLYIFEMLKKSCGSINPGPQDMFELYDLGVSAYTHVGDPFKAEKCFEECRKQIDYVEVSDFTQTEVRLITTLFDQFKYNKAESLAAEILGNKALQESNEQRVVQEESREGENVFVQFVRFLFAKPTETKDSTPNNEKKEGILDKLVPPTVRKTSYKTWSSLGQSYSFQRLPEAERCFISVLDVLDKNNANYYITLSYLLHYYIDHNMKDEYEKYSCGYFGDNENIEDQFNYLFLEQTNPGFSLGYALFVFIKAFYFFYKEDKTLNSILNKLVSLQQVIEDAQKHKHIDSVTGHPWEIIYKYCSMLELYEKKSIYNSINRLMIKESVKHARAEVIDLVMMYGDIEYFKLKTIIFPRNKRYHEEVARKIDKLWKKMVNKGIVAKQSDTLEEKEKALEKVFSYMYH